MSARKPNNKTINAESFKSAVAGFLFALMGMFAAFRRREEDYSSLSLAL